MTVPLLVAEPAWAGFGSRVPAARSRVMTSSALSAVLNVLIPVASANLR
ncbi:hypothetical protein ACFQZ4_51700 [Catellatospora coxensis]